jgi:flagellum-specific peptidoglycan hydrolase FlgJ
VAAEGKPWWQQATALVTVTTGGMITGLSFVPGTAAAATAPAAVPLHLLALQQAAQPAAPGGTAAGDAQVRTAIVNVAKYYLQLARANTPAQVEALIWGKVSTDGAGHGPSCAAFASLALELAAQATGHQSWATGGTTYPWPVAEWADVRVDTSPASPAITSMQADAQAHGRWHPLGDGYTPQPGDWVLYDGHVEVVVSYTNGTLTTIGADSLPNLTVNEHSSSTPLADQGVAGFVDNGNLPLAAGTQPAAAPAHQAPAVGVMPSPAATAAHAPAGTAQPPAAASASAPGAEVPGLPGAAAFTSAGGIPGAGGTPAHAESAGRTASVPGLLTLSGSPGTTLSKGAAVIPGASPSPPAHATTPAAPKTTAPKEPAQAQGGTSRGAASAATPAQQAFIAAVAPGAVAAQQKYGVPASVTIAQAIDESGWGQSSLAAQNHNLFGIKGSGPAGSVTLPTQEFEGGNWVTIDAQFAAYHNDAESIAGHAQLLATSGYYTKAMADRADPDAFASDLTGVYATDPSYGTTLIGLMTRYNLYQYDTAQASVPAAAARAAPTAPAKPAKPAATPTGSGGAAVPGVTTPALSASLAPAPAGTGIPGLVPAGPARVVTTAYVTPARSVPPRSTVTNAAAPQAATAPALAAGIAGAAAAGGAGLAAAGRRRAARYTEPLPQATANALFASARGPLSRGEHLYRDVAAGTGVSWELLAAADWMQCEADPRRSPVHGEKLGTRNGDGTAYPVRSAALARCARDLRSLAAAVYGIDLTAPVLSVRELAAAFAAFRWGALLKRHDVSAMEFPYSVAGLTGAHHKMRWPAIDAPGAPDRPGSRFHGPFGAVPVLLSLGYPATTG